MTKVDFHVLWLQAGGGCKISEVQVRVIIIGRGCLVLLKFKFKLCKDYVPLVLDFLVLIRHPCVLKNYYP